MEAVLQTFQTTLSGAWQVLRSLGRRRASAAEGNAAQAQCEQDMAYALLDEDE